MKGWLRRNEHLLYLFPALFGILVFTIYPIINVILMSFKENYRYLTDEFSGFGFENYALVVQDPIFQQAMRNTFAYVICVVPIALAIAVVIATLLNQNIKFKGLLQTAYFLPMVTSVTAVGLAWKFMFNYNSGIINYFLGLFQISPINWLQDPKFNFIALVIYGIWSILPFSIIIILSGLQNIDPQYYLAAKIDGAKPMRIFFRITVPLLSSTIGLLTVVNTISSFKVFNELFPLFQGPGVSYNLFTVVYYIYYQFRGLTPPKYGLAAASAVLLFLVIFVFTMIQLRIQKFSKTKES
ncbi:MAG: carbohydrate ABC transporter permease [Erysipelotrichaceae bacterium]